jgi:hypothetical protein
MFWAEALRSFRILSVASKGAVGLTSLGHAMSLFILHNIRSHLQGRGDR